MITGPSYGGGARASAPLDAAYADAMRAVARKYPEDLDAQSLLAEALMDTAPWNYWTPEKELKPAAREAVAAIEYVLSRVPAHPGADHLYIHLIEAGPRPKQAEPSADRLGKLAPGSGHLVHMPSHIYVRVGRYHDAVVVNERAIRAAAALELLHTFAIVHDDVMDRSRVRRGRPASWVELAEVHRREGMRGDPASFGVAAASMIGNELPPFSANRIFTAMGRAISGSES